MEIQQSAEYATYITSLGWTAIRLKQGRVYIRKIPLVGGIIKIQRTKTLPSVQDILALVSEYKIRTIAIEPDASVSVQKFSAWKAQLPRHVVFNTDYYLPTKTILIDLKPAPNHIFSHFSEAKRRAVRRAIKNNLFITTDESIDAFIRLKNKSAGFLGTITTYGLDKLWQILKEKNKAVLMAKTQDGKNIAGIALLVWDSIAYYWMAGATTEGKKLFAPTLLVWEAIKLAQKMGAKHLDFVGVWDERIPNKNKEWKGFTKFKEGFGGKTLYYPIITK